MTYRDFFYANWLKRQTGVKLVYELHNTPYYECLDIADKRRESRWGYIIYGRLGIERLLRYFYARKYQRIYNWCDAFGLLCEGYRQQLINELSLSAERNKTFVLSNPIEPSSNVVTPKAHEIIYVGRLTHRDKRVDRLLRIWQQVQPQIPGWKLKIIGDGRAKDKLRQMAISRNLQEVSFEGRTNNVKSYYDRAAILCLTSSFEGWPMCVAEAQREGVVPVVFNSFAGAVNQIATPDEGVLIEPFDESAFAHALVELATNDERRERMSCTVIKKAVSYSITRSGATWEEMLSAINHC